MKELSEITTSLEISKRMKEAGFPQDSMFYRNVNTGKVRFTQRGNPDLAGLKFGEPKKTFKEKVKEGIYISSYTTDELLELLPEVIYGRDLIKIKYPSNDCLYRRIDYSDDLHRCGYWTNNPLDTCMFSESEKLPDAIGELILYLKKEGLL